MAIVRSMICKPFSVYGQAITARQIANVIDDLANAPPQFRAHDLVRGILPGAAYIDKQEALNRLCQRWRKLGLLHFDKGRWSLAKGAWDTLQLAAAEARQPATQQAESPQ